LVASGIKVFSLSGDSPLLHADRSIAIIDITLRPSRNLKAMANLLVRGIDDALVQALRERAARHGRSAEAEHREILAASLRRPRKRSVADVLAAMPNVGHDEDFARKNDAGKTPNVFG
jgi:plasmid stability protein